MITLLRKSEIKYFFVFVAFLVYDELKHNDHSGIRTFFCNPVLGCDPAFEKRWRS